MKQKGKKTVVKRNTSININGKRYDALTGNLLHDPIVPRKANVSSKTTAKSIDGVSKAQTAPAASVATLAKPLPASQVPRGKAAHAKAHQLTPSKTLMRNAVSKPATPSLKRRAKVQSAVAVHQPHLVIDPIKVTKKVSIHGVNKHRANRASQASTSTRVAHFAHEISVAVTAFEQAVVIPDTSPATTIYRTAAAQAAQQASSKPDIFEQALRRATSHEQPEHNVAGTKKARRAARSLRHRMVSYGAGAMAVLAIAGFLSFTNSSTMQFRMATRGAGFSATMPSYKPQNFTVASVKTVNGYVNINYVRKTNINTPRTSFALTQKASSWDSQTLVANIADSNPDYNVVQTSKGAIFLYGRNQAAWVHHGVLYQVLGNGALTTQDFSQIASSM